MTLFLLTSDKFTKEIFALSEMNEIDGEKSFKSTNEDFNQQFYKWYKISTLTFHGWIRIQPGENKGINVNWCNN